MYEICKLFIIISTIFYVCRVSVPNGFHIIQPTTYEMYYEHEIVIYKPIWNVISWGGLEVIQGKSGVEYEANSNLLANQKFVYITRQRDTIL